jgi:predicted nuclease of predicted toxin-antitoxin system
MRFLADQDVYQITIEWLKGTGHNVVTAAELGLSRASDESLLEKAAETDRLMLTRDKGFGALLFLKAAKKSGVVLLRGLPSAIEEMHGEFQRLLEEHQEEELKGSFCVIEPHRHRIRHL